MKRVYIICSGPSLNGFDFGRLTGEDVICMNDNYKYIPEESIVAYVSLDPVFLINNREDLKDVHYPLYSPANYGVNPIRKELGVIELPITGINGIEYGEGIRHGVNSGYMAMGLAIKLGYKDIRVLGMDLSPRGHFYDPDFKYNFDYVHKHLRAFKKDLKKDIHVTFYGDTHVDLFEKYDLSEILKTGKMTKKKTEAVKKAVATKDVAHTASEGHVIVEVLKPYQGMTKELVKGDIIEIPERQMKSRLVKGGFIKAYDKGDKKPMHR